MKSIQRDGDVSEKEIWKSLMSEKNKAAKDSWGMKYILRALLLILCNKKN